MICGINTTSDISKLLYVIWDNFEISRVVFKPNADHVQVMLLFVYTTTHKRLVIFTCRYFKLNWNTTVLSQSNCTNFSCSSCNLLLVMTFTKSTYQNLSQCRHIAFQDYTSPNSIFNLHIQVNVIERVCVIGPKVVEVYNWSLERLRFTFTANGKRQTQVENFSE